MWKELDPPLENEMLEAINAPRPPFERIFKQLADIMARSRWLLPPRPARRESMILIRRTRLFAKRLVNLGYADIPEIGAVRTSAIDHLLSQHAAKDIPARFDAGWSKKAQA